MQTQKLGNGAYVDRLFDIVHALQAVPGGCGLDTGSGETCPVPTHDYAAAVTAESRWGHRDRAMTASAILLSSRG
jgi:hypothetical protein